MQIKYVLRWIPSEGNGFRTVINGSVNGSITTDIGALIPVGGCVVGAFPVNNFAFDLYGNSEKAKIYFSNPLNHLQNLNPGDQGVYLFIFDQDFVGLTDLFDPVSLAAYPGVQKTIPYQITGMDVMRPGIGIGVNYIELNKAKFDAAIALATKIITKYQDAIDLGTATHAQKQVWEDWKQYRFDLYQLNPEVNAPLNWPTQPADVANPTT